MPSIYAQCHNVELPKICGRPIPDATTKPTLVANPVNVPIKPRWLTKYNLVLINITTRFK